MENCGCARGESGVASRCSLYVDGPSTIPNGPYGDTDSLSSLRSYDQLIGALESIVNSSQGAVTLAYGR